ncbi:MAG: hypothetical protein GXO43_09560 [Crenarchaeota archaeon]|nr:hypothetical protein [Thermoproteota archaeon]
MLIYFTTISLLSDPATTFILTPIRLPLLSFVKNKKLERTLFFNDTIIGYKLLSSSVTDAGKTTT